MNESNYEEYKRNLSRAQKKRDGLHNGKISLVVGIGLLLYVLYILPFRAANVRDMRGDELKAWKAYYIEDLQLLHAEVDEDNDRIYCIAQFLDHDLNPWIILFSPDTDKQLAEQIKFWAAYEKKFNLTVNGYVYLEDILGRANSYFSAYSSSYADSGGRNKLQLCANYLCRVSGNYTLRALFRPSRALASFVCGLLGVVHGGVMLLKHRTRKTAQT